jgi:hypothetical protein
MLRSVVAGIIRRLRFGSVGPRRYARSSSLFVLLKISKRYRVWEGQLSQKRRDRVLSDSVINS